MDARHPAMCGMIPQSKVLSRPNANGIPDEKHVGYYLICKMSIQTR